MKKLLIITALFMAIGCKKDKLPECLQWGVEKQHTSSTASNKGYFKLEEPNKIQYKLTWNSGIIKGTFEVNDSLIVITGDSSLGNKTYIRNYCSSNYSIVSKKPNGETGTVWQ